MKTVWLWIKKWWWAIVGGIGMLVGLIISALLRRERKGAEPGKSDTSMTQLAKEEYDRAKTDIQIERAKKRVETDVQKKILEDIASDPDVKTQRERYSRWATDNL